MLEQAEEEERIRKQDELDGMLYVLYLVAFGQKMFLMAIESNNIGRNIKIDYEIKDYCTQTFQPCFEFAGLENFVIYHTPSNVGHKKCP